MESHVRTVSSDQALRFVVDSPEAMLEGPVDHLPIYVPSLNAVSFNIMAPFGEGFETKGFAGMLYLKSFKDLIKYIPIYVEDLFKIKARANLEKNEAMQSILSKIDSSIKAHGEKYTELYNTYLKYIESLENAQDRLSKLNLPQDTQKILAEFNQLDVIYNDWNQHVANFNTFFANIKSECEKLLQEPASKLPDEMFQAMLTEYNAAAIWAGISVSDKALGLNSRFPDQVYNIRVRKNAQRFAKFAISLSRQEKPLEFLCLQETDDRAIGIYLEELRRVGLNWQSTENYVSGPTGLVSTIYNADKWTLTRTTKKELSYPNELAPTGCTIDFFKEKNGMEVACANAHVLFTGEGKTTNGAHGRFEDVISYLKMEIDNIPAVALFDSNHHFPNQVGVSLIPSNYRSYNGGIADRRSDIVLQNVPGGGWGMPEQTALLITKDTFEPGVVTLTKRNDAENKVFPLYDKKEMNESTKLLASKGFPSLEDPAWAFEFTKYMFLTGIEAYQKRKLSHLNVAERVWYGNTYDNQAKVYKQQLMGDHSIFYYQVILYALLSASKDKIDNVLQTEINTNYSKISTELWDGIENKIEIAANFNSDESKKQRYLFHKLAIRINKEAADGALSKETIDQINVLEEKMGNALKELKIPEQLKIQLDQYSSAIKAEPQNSADIGKKWGELQRRFKEVLKIFDQTIQNLKNKITASQLSMIEATRSALDGALLNNKFDDALVLLGVISQSLINVISPPTPTPSLPLSPQKSSPPTLMGISLVIKNLKKQIEANDNSELKEKFASEKDNHKNELQEYFNKALKTVDVQIRNLKKLIPDEQFNELVIIREILEKEISENKFISAHQKLNSLLLTFKIRWLEASRPLFINEALKMVDQIKNLEDHIAREDVDEIKKLTNIISFTEVEYGHAINVLKRLNKKLPETSEESKSMVIGQPIKQGPGKQSLFATNKEPEGENKEGENKPAQKSVRAPLPTPGGGKDD